MKFLNGLFLLIFAIIIGLLFWFPVFWFSDSFLNHMDKAGIILGYGLSCFSIALGAIAWFKRRDIRIWAFRKKFENVGEEFDLDKELVDAMVIPVSPHPDQPEWILRWLKPKHVSFLYTDQSQSVAQKLADEFSKPPYNINFYPNSKDIELGKHKIESPDKPEITKSISKLLLNRLLEKDLDRAKIIVDTTGGKVPMSIGAFQAAEELNISSIYVIGRGKNGWIEKPKNREDGVPKFMSDHTEF